VRVLGHVGIDGNEAADQVARQGSSHALTGPQAALGIPAKDAREVIRDWTSRKHEEHICGYRQNKCLLIRPFVKKAGELITLNRNQIRIMIGLLTEHCHLKGHLLKPGLVNSLCDRCKQAYETSSHILCDCQALVTWVVTS
jgi:hypothetical protein